MFVSVLARVEGLVGELTATFRDHSVAGAQAESALARVAAVRHALGGLEAELAVLATDAGAWRQSGHASPVEWLAAKTGTSPGAAKGRLTLGEQLATLPETRERLAEGAVSVEQAAAIASAAAANPAAERALLEAAGRESLSELRDRAARVKAATEDAEARAKRQHSLRRVRKGADPDGLITTFGAHPPIDATVVWSAIDLRTDEIFDAARRNGLREGRDAYAADALRDICQDWLDARNGTRGDDAGAPRKRLPLGARAKVLVRVDHKVLATGAVEDGDVCEIAGYGPISVRQCRDLMQDAFLAALLVDGTDVRRVVHLGRKPTALQETALQELYQTCAIAGCGRTRRLETDHRVEWAATQHTTLTELERLCPHHHGLKTRGWQLVRDDAGWRLEDAGQHARQPRAG